MKTVGLGALVVAAVMMTIGVTQGLNGNHDAAIPAVVISLVALLIGVALVRE